MIRDGIRVVGSGHPVDGDEGNDGDNDDGHRGGERGGQVVEVVVVGW